MKQVVTIVGEDLVKVSASIMPLDSKKWNVGRDDDEKFKQIPLSLTFNLTGVLDGVEVTKVTPLLERAMDGYFIDARQALKAEAATGMELKSQDEKYQKMVEMVPEWESRTIALPLRTGRKPGEASRLKAEVKDLKAANTMTEDLIDMHIRYAQKIKPSELIGIIRKAQEISAHMWEAEKGKVEAELLNASKK